jgi:hypothetical protein
MTPEQQIASSVNAVLAPFLAIERERSRRQHSLHGARFSEFAGWCKLYGVDPLAGADILAGFLLEAAANGAPVPELTEWATAVDWFYRLRGAYLDPEPINAALALVAEQMSPHRTLN